MNDRSVIQASFPCSTCGYDLRGLSVAGKCPECGTDVVKTNPECPRCGMFRIALECSRETPGVWRCVECTGIAFERGALRKSLTDASGSSSGMTGGPVELVAQTSVSCGRCRVAMTSIMVGGTLMIDRCGTCGLTWLDAGEFSAVAAYVKGITGNRQIPTNLERVLHDPVALRKALHGGDVTPGLVSLVVEAILTGFLS